MRANIDEVMFITSHVVKYLFHVLSVTQLVAVCAVLSMYLWTIYILLISPVIFNYFIIPSIEKKLGKKLPYHVWLNYIVLGKWMCRQTEIAIYIFSHYCAWRFKKKRDVPRYFNRFPLSKENYPIEAFSKKEIFFSFMLLLSFLIVIICGIVFGFLTATRMVVFPR